MPTVVDASGANDCQPQQKLHNRVPASPHVTPAFAGKSPPPQQPTPQLMLSLNDGTLYTRNLLLRGMCLIYLMAFVGFYYQSPGKIMMTMLGLNKQKQPAIINQQVTGNAHVQRVKTTATIPSNGTSLSIQALCNNVLSAVAEPQAKQHTKNDSNVPHSSKRAAHFIQHNNMH